MKRFLVFISVVLAAQHAQATACDYSGKLSFGQQVIESHECWDLTGWPANKASQFCSMMGMADSQNAAFNAQGFGAKQMPSCPTGSVARCENAKFRAPGAEPLDDAYYEQFPAEMRAEIRANAEAAMAGTNAAFAPYAGLNAVVHYYADASGFIKLADQKMDCEQTKGGRFTQ